jgi:hypothetical protein
MNDASLCPWYLQDSDLYVQPGTPAANSSPKPAKLPYYYHKREKPVHQPRGRTPKLLASTPKPTPPKKKPKKKRKKVDGSDDDSDMDPDWQWSELVL